MWSKLAFSFNFLVSSFRRNDGCGYSVSVDLLDIYRELNCRSAARAILQKFSKTAGTSFVFNGFFYTISFFLLLSSAHSRLCAVKKLIGEFAIEKLCSVMSVSILSSINSFLLR